MFAALRWGTGRAVVIGDGSEVCDLAVGPLPGRRCVRTATSAMPCPMNRWEPACNSDGANASLDVAEELAAARLSGSCVSEGSLLASSCGPGMPIPPSWQAPSPRPP